MSPKTFRFLVWVNSDGTWRLNATSRTRANAEKQAAVFKKRKGVKVRIDDSLKGEVKPARNKPPKSAGKGWKRRTRKRGKQAREFIDNASQRKRKTVPDLKIAIKLVKNDDLDETSFINLVLALGWSQHEAYTFFFSPP